ncbi:hypothetical protein TraAM80_06915 [Trypanosoma rangeli]|uniref:Uncharacterized protein n=1 Tax=Trypanosoma rangeli TaxID=5698 RepID=A0A422N7S6_TRYRA|nr:uncharacterized protein TraAM80_06915 [Trypanosoma rangeli]RNF01544.1 hypothetical protein TraAM80_06915 [Trypanosoma rangeli]|eukprot:RNF01544.1 hypothetical protein TraAM80_06915 [Trypanosoma rangeli]
MTPDAGLATRSPFVFVEQLHEGQPYDTITFPDAFEILPNSWQYKSAMGAVPSANSSTVAGASNSSQSSSTCLSSLSSDEEHVLVLRGLHEEQRLQLARRVRERRDLQMRSGQIPLDACCRQPYVVSVVARELTAEGRRRAETRSVPHILWATRNRALTAFYAEQRRRCLLLLASRLQERTELEHYAGTTRDKLRLSRKKRLWASYKENKKSFFSPVAADECEPDSSDFQYVHVHGR